MIVAAFYAVDVFFFLSSFLGTLLLLEKFYGKKINFLAVYAHRFLRLLPALMLVSFAVMTFWEFIGDGP